MITLQCSKCYRNYHVGDEFAGKDVFCKNCKELLTVPSADEKKSETWFDPTFDTCSIFMTQNHELLQALLKQEREAPPVEMQAAR